MRTTAMTIKLPSDLDRAVRDEASRRLSPHGPMPMRPSEIIAEALRWAWPRYVAERLSRELGTIDADVVDEVPALSP